MDNRRPNYNLSLTLLAGALVNCTLKTPKLKLTRQVRQLVVESQMKAEECNALYNTTGELNARLAQADRDVIKAQATGATDELVANAQATRDALQKELDAVVAKVNSLNEDQFSILEKQVALVVNIPNDPDTQAVRGTELIDWDENDQDELRNAVSFFLNGPQK